MFLCPQYPGRPASEEGKGAYVADIVNVSVDELIGQLVSLSTSARSERMTIHTAVKGSQTTIEISLYNAGESFPCAQKVFVAAESEGTMEITPLHKGRQF